MAGSIDRLDLDQVVDQNAVRQVEPALRRLRERIAARAGGGPIYFPFALSDRRPPRATQGYLVKVPRDVIRMFRGLHGLLVLADQGAEEGPAEEVTPVNVRRPDKDGRIADTEVRSALERHAVDLVRSEFRRRGYTVLDVGSRKSWDVEARRGGEELHIEVKGSSGTRDAVELTDNEVRHAEDYSQSLLVVVDQIQWHADGRKVLTEGGRWREWTQWMPERSALLPTRYRYVLPDHDHN